MRKILGVDPGLKGGLSVIDERFNFIASIPMPVKTAADGSDRIDSRPIYDFIEEYKPDLVVFEQVGSRPRQKGVFKFGEGFGIVLGDAELLCDNIMFSRPQEWQGHQSLIGLSKKQIAEVAFAVFKAEAIYGKPRAGKRAVRDGISDSLMIAKFGVRFLE